MIYKHLSIPCYLCSSDWTYSENSKSLPSLHPTLIVLIVLPGAFSEGGHQLYLVKDVVKASGHASYTCVDQMKTGSYDHDFRAHMH
jgi:hypothetical protein